MQRAARPGRRQPAEVDREEQDQHQPDPELRQRQAEQGEELARTVPEPADPHRGQDAARDADQQRQAHRHHRQQQRVGQALEVELHHRRAIVEGLAEIAGREARHEMPVLLPKRPIEPELAAHGLDVVRAGAGLDQQAHRIAGDAHEQEDDERQQEQRHQGIADPAEDVLFHGNRSPAHFMSSGPRA